MGIQNLKQLVSDARQNSFTNWVVANKGKVNLNHQGVSITEHNTEWRTYSEKGKVADDKVNLQKRGRHSGITYDLRDDFIDLANKGIIKDKDGKFTKKDAYNLYLALDKIQKQKKLNTNYHHMKGGSKFDYSEKEVEDMIKAAGYDIVDKQKVYPQFINENDATRVKKPEVIKPFRLKA